MRMTSSLGGNCIRTPRIIIEGIEPIFTKGNHSIIAYFANAAWTTGATK